MNGIHTPTPERAGGPAETTSSHAMLVFGTGVDCYLSNLARFSPPHNAQAVLAVELDDRGRRALGADRRRGYDGLHTFVPEEFAPAELADGSRKSLRGTLFRGHVRRASSAPVAEVAADIRQVVYFHELAPRRAPTALTHLVFGAPGRLYVAHRIGARPSFDQIVAARLVPGTVTDLLGVPDPARAQAADSGFERAQEIILGRRDFAGQRLRAGERAVAAFGSDDDGYLAELEVLRQIYLEVADLV
ncbi:hypothetical protein ACFVMC_13755 [Nocardia sp. NPDC127579]|uniref:hypothetical protein n=1 Tax=Nocardia sp. NPDC127579 TaxID=3345402 RepID=UPI0036454076